jgi:hypothetical protein
MDSRRFSASLEPLAFPARQRKLADTAKALAGTRELEALLAELDEQGVLPARWAITMAVIARDEAYLRRHLTVPYVPVALIALDYCVRHGLDYDAIVEAVPAAPMAWRRALYGKVRAHRAAVLAERLLPLVRATFGDHEAVGLLSACGPATVAELLPELDFALPNLKPLARLHPGVVLDHLRRRLAEATESGRAAVWTRFASAAGQIARTEPHGLLELLELQGPVVGLPAETASWLATLARVDPERVVAILADPVRNVRLRFGRTLLKDLRQARDEALTALVRVTISDEQRLAALLRGLPPSRRAAILEGALDGKDLAQAGLSPAILDLLPWAARHAHARRLLGTRAVADDPTRRLTVTARLPWPEAEPVLRAETADAVPDYRARGYSLLIQAAAATRDPATVGGVLSSLTRLANEQDPVRSVALGAIADLPAWLFRPADVAALDKLATDATEARDASWATRQAVAGLAVKLVRHGLVSHRQELAECGLGMMERSGEYTRSLGFRRLDTELPRGGEHSVFAALRRRIAADARRDLFDLALALASGLRRRAWAMPELQEYVRAATSSSRDSTVRTAIGLWLAPAETRDERVEVLFRRDRSVITVHDVADAIGRRRTDLLDEALSKPLHGRFLARGVRFVPTFRGVFGHWLPRQVKAYADLLEDLATSPKASVHERASAMRSLGRLPGIGAEAVRPFLGDERVAVIEAAMGALAWTDRPDQVLSELLGYADTDRARVAVYAATRCARYTPPAELAEVLKGVLSGKKVTSRKEAIRLIAEHHVPGAVDMLTELWARPALHRDLRRAIVSAARWLLDDERVWGLLAGAAAEKGVATALTEVAPHTVAERHRARFGGLVRIVAGDADADTALTGLAAWPAWSFWDREGPAVVIARFSDLAATATWRAALDALVTSCTATDDFASLDAALTSLAGIDGQAGPERDLPVRQRIRHFADRLGGEVRGRGELVRAAIEGLALRLAEMPEYRLDGIALALACLPGTGDLLAPLRRIAALAERPALAWEAASLLGGRLSRALDQRQTLSTARELAAGSPAEALFSVSIARELGGCAGWPSPWRELVSTLRGHADPDVRLRALDTPTAPE